MGSITKKNRLLATLTELNPSWSHVKWCKLCIHLKSLSGIKNYGNEVIFNDKISLPNLIKIYQLVQSY
jgi:hypothetical protein